jgi:Leucine rich repeat
MSARTVELSQLIEKIAPNSTVLDLRGYGLETLPENIGDLTYLTKLNLNGNRLTSLPESIGNLTNLTELYLNGHKLTTLPESIGNLTNLTRLDLNGDLLESLPESISNLNQLIKLNLISNKFDRIPEAILSLPKLKKVNLNSNPLTDLSCLKHLPKIEVYRSNNASRFTLLKRQDIFIIAIGNFYLNDLILDLSSFANIVCLRLYSFGLNRISTNEENAKKYVKERLDSFFLSSDKMLNLVFFHWDISAHLYMSLLD